MGEVSSRMRMTLLSGSLTGDYVRSGNADESDNLGREDDEDW